LPHALRVITHPQYEQQYEIDASHDGYHGHRKCQEQPPGLHPRPPLVLEEVQDLSTTKAL